MTIQYHDPKAAPSTPAMPYRLAADLDGTITIGLLANGFPDSRQFLDAVESSLKKSVPNAAFKRYNKRNPSICASEELMGEIANDCTAFISAYGH
ncbi:MAG: hypothetical protein ABGZ35_27500 [Planctomycetaceae bacterium]|jgi:hypothetical protein